MLSDPTTFYYLSLFVAVLLYIGLRYLVRTPLGLALQGIRDNARRMQSLGYTVSAHRLAGFILAGFVASLGGILGVWYNGAISSGSIDLTRTTNMLVIAVLGGLSYFEGAFVGAIFFTLITNFASSFTDRFNTVIGLALLLVALFFPDGLIGLPGKTPQLVLRMTLWRRQDLTAMAIPARTPHHSSPLVALDEQLMTASVNPEEKEKEQ